MNTPDTPFETTAASSSPVEVIRSEEQVRVGISSTPRSILRIRKVIVSEQQTVTVTLRREELRITEEPATDDATASGLLADPGDELVLVLHAEEVDVSTRVVPVERVRVRKARVESTTAITESVRREQVQVISADESEIG
jgi:uncharacterized protein (TIGR02271 family)